MSRFVPVSLYFLYSPGCAACEEAEPEIRRLESRYPSLMVVPVNAELRDELLGYRITKTPTYLLSIAGEVAWAHEGALRIRDIERAMTKAGVQLG